MPFEQAVPLTKRPTTRPGTPDTRVLRHMIRKYWVRVAAKVLHSRPLPQFNASRHILVPVLSCALPAVRHREVPQPSSFVALGTRWRSPRQRSEAPNEGTHYARRVSIGILSCPRRCYDARPEQFHSNSPTEALAGFDNLTNGFVTQAQFDIARETFEEREASAKGSDRSTTHNPVPSVIRVPSPARSARSRSCAPGTMTLGRTRSPIILEGP